MRLIRDGTSYVWRGDYSTRHLPKAAGFRWDPERRVWWTAFLENAAKLAEYAEEPLRSELLAVGQQREAAIQASRSRAADIDVPAPAGLQYLPFQKAGIAYALSRQNTLLADQMGLGKTIQAIGVLNSIAAQRVLVICPASLKLNWKRELEKWLTKSLTVAIGDSQCLPGSDVVILNYDILPQHHAALREREWDLLIVDEAAYCKNPRAQRTQQVLGNRDRGGDWVVEPIAAKRKLFLTGTPLLNRPIELWPLASSLAPDVFASFWNFAKRYCNAYESRYGWDFSGASNLEELQEKLRASIMCRRLKSEVLAELPAKRRQVIELPANGLLTFIRAEQDVAARHEQRLAELKAAVELAKVSDNPDDYATAVKQLRADTQVMFTEISTLRHNTALAKVPYVIEHLRLSLEESKVVCFAHHRDVIAAIAAEFDSAVTLTGEDTLAERQDAIDKFQNDPLVRLFVGSIMAAGLGITLTASSHVVFAELDWVPGNVTQAEDRLHRIGQRDSVLVQHLVLEGSLDATMARVLVEKQEIIDAVLDAQLAQEPVAPISHATVTRQELGATLPPEQVAERT